MNDDKHQIEQLAYQSRLAAKRTALSNERTLLAYVRTALAFTAGGASLVFLVESNVSTAFGWTGIVFGEITLAFGFWRYYHVSKDVLHIAKHEDEDED